MLSRVRIASGLALLLTLLTSITVFAKGGYSFIIVTGGQLTDEIRISDPALTEDFFTFADFYQDKAEQAPLDPGVGYEIKRYYVNGYSETAFDKLHYYPETGFVYYDGIVNGSSEYDGKWYTAKPEIQKTFETVLFTELRLIKLGTQEGSQALVPPAERAQVSAPAIAPIPQAQPMLPIMMGVGLAVVIAFAFLGWRRHSLR